MFGNQYFGLVGRGSIVDPTRDADLPLRTPKMYVRNNDATAGDIEIMFGDGTTLIFANIPSGGFVPCEPILQIVDAGTGVTSLTVGPLR